MTEIAANSSGEFKHSLISYENYQNIIQNGIDLLVRKQFSSEQLTDTDSGLLVAIPEQVDDVTIFAYLYPYGDGARSLEFGFVDAEKITDRSKIIEGITTFRAILSGQNIENIAFFDPPDISDEYASWLLFKQDKLRARQSYSQRDDTPLQQA